MQRRHLLQAGSAVLLAAPALLRAQALEKPKTTIAVGGKNLLYYLPLTIAEQRGYFKAEGLDVTIVDFAGGARALQAVVGGSADVVSGAFEHTVNMQAQGPAPARLRAAGPRAADRAGREPEDDGRLQDAGRPEGQEDRRHGAGFQFTNVMVNFFLAKAGLKPSDVSDHRRRCGAGRGGGDAQRGRSTPSATSTR